VYGGADILESPYDAQHGFTSFSKKKSLGVVMFSKNVLPFTTTYK